MLTNSKKPLIAFLFLLITSLACYSDSPLWVFGVTDVPPTVTFLPTPGTGPNEYPAKLERGDLALAPNPTTASQAFFFVTRLPEDLQTGVRNAGGSCDYGAQLDILYIGNQFDNFKGSMYIDDVMVNNVGADGQVASSETLFDFEDNVGDWDVYADFAASEDVNHTSNVDFVVLAGVDQIELVTRELDGILADVEAIPLEELDGLKAVQADLEQAETIFDDLSANETYQATVPNLRSTVQDLNGILDAMESNSSVANVNERLAEINDILNDIESLSLEDTVAVEGVLRSIRILNNTVNPQAPVDDLNVVMMNRQVIVDDVENASIEDITALFDEIQAALEKDREDIRLTNLPAAYVQDLNAVVSELQDMTEIPSDNDLNYLANTVLRSLIDGQQANIEALESVSAEDLELILGQIDAAAQLEQDNLKLEALRNVVTDFQTIVDAITAEGGTTATLVRDPLQNGVLVPLRGTVEILEVRLVLENASQFLLTHQSVLEAPENATLEELQALLSELQTAVQQDRDAIETTHIHEAFARNLSVVRDVINGLLDGREDVLTNLQAVRASHRTALLAPEDITTEELEAILDQIEDALSADLRSVEVELKEMLVEFLRPVLDDATILTQGRERILDDLLTTLNNIERDIDDSTKVVADLEIRIIELSAALQKDRQDVVDLAVEVNNPSGVLRLEADYKGDNWLAATKIDFAENSNELTGYNQLSLRVFVPLDADPFFASLHVKTNSGEEISTARIDLPSGRWTTLTLDLTTLSDPNAISELSVQIGPNPDKRFYLITCSGTVGWADENRLAGPIRITSGQSALTLNVGSNGNPIAPGFAFGVAESPPLPGTAVRDDTSQNCAADEVVDILNIFAYQTETGAQDLWYQIECNSGRGWVIEDRLLGPLVLPDVGGVGMISSENVDGVELTENLGPTSDENPVVGTCEASHIISTTGFGTIPGDEPDELIPYYQIECGDLVGWTEQSVLLEIPYFTGSDVVVVGLEDVSGFNVEEAIAEAENASTEGTTEGAAEEDDGTDAIVRSLRASYLNGDIELAELEDRLHNLLVEQGRYNGDANEFLSATLTIEPGLPFEENIRGECPSGTIVTLEDVGSSEGNIYYFVTCGDTQGWIDSTYIPNRVELEIGSAVWFIRPSTGFRDGREIIHEGYSLRLEPVPVGEEIPDWQCVLFESATVNRVVIYQRALKRLGFSLFYEVTCHDLNGIQISGFVEQREIIPDVLDRDPITLVGG